MSANYIRTCAVTFAYIGKTKQSTLAQPNTATILLTNQNPGLAKA